MSHGDLKGVCSRRLESPLENSRPTKSSDCYALAMVVYETITGHLPFHEHADLTVFVKVLKDMRPPREPGFADSLWETLELCWAPQPSARPNIEDVLCCLECVSRSLEQPSPRINGGMNRGDDWDSMGDSRGTSPRSIPSASFRAPGLSRSPVSILPPHIISVRQTPAHPRSRGGTELLR